MRDGGGSMDVDEPKIHPSTAAGLDSYFNFSLLAFTGSKIHFPETYTKLLKTHLKLVEYCWNFLDEHVAGPEPLPTFMRVVKKRILRLWPDLLTTASNSGAAAASAAASAAAPSKTTDSLEDLDKAIEDIDINDVNASDLDDDDLLADDDDGADLLSD